MSKKLCCPKCKSTELQYSVSNDMHFSAKGGGYSGGKGCLGFLFFGPLGLLCGSCGSKQKINASSTQNTMWVCKSCGNKFNDLDEVNARLKKALGESYGGLIAVFLIAAIGYGAFLANVMHNGISGYVYSFILCGIFCAALVISHKNRNKQIIEALYKEQEYLKAHAYFDDGE